MEDPAIAIEADHCKKNVSDPTRKPYLIFVTTTLAATGGLPFFHRERKMDCVQQSLLASQSDALIVAHPHPSDRPLISQKQ